MIKDSKLYTRNKLYTVFHWFMHFLFAHLLVLLTQVDLVGYSIDLSPIGWNTTFRFFDYFLVYFITVLFDFDHMRVLKRYGFKGIFKFARKRIQFPLHNFFVFGMLSLAAAISALAGVRQLSIILLAPVLHMVWDMVEDVVVFKTSYRKWEKTWGIGTKELERLWEEIKDSEKKSR